MNQEMKKCRGKKSQKLPTSVRLGRSKEKEGARNEARNEYRGKKKQETANVCKARGKRGETKGKKWSKK